MAKEFKFEYYGNNRHLCDVLEDLRKCYETRNFAPVLGLIEEAQIMGNRMESGLRDVKDLKALNGDVASARRAYKELKREYLKLQKEIKANSKK